MLALWAAKGMAFDGLELYILDSQVPPPPYMPYDHRSVPELYRRNGRIYTLHKWAAFQFCTVLLRILAEMTPQKVTSIAEPAFDTFEMVPC